MSGAKRSNRERCLVECGNAKIETKCVVTIWCFKIILKTKELFLVEKETFVYL